MESADKGVASREIEEEMRSSYLDYAMSVLVGRALPSAQDGLKPVHRRVLYAMRDLGLFHNKPFRKSARIVGDALGKYHPHGDSAVYDTLVRMAQDFSLRYPLVNGQGNFGSIDGDNAAAMRYTEAKLTKIAEEMLQDIEKDTVDMVPNFDNSLKEPSVLPSKFPNLLVNGSSGIAVGMATNIPPHNLPEVVSALKATIDNPEIPAEDLLNHISGPDFPTGAQILGDAGIKLAYRTGRGLIKVRGRAETEERRIIITEIPYMVNKSSMIEEMADLVTSKRVTGISDIRDESDKNGMRIVIDTKRDASPDVILNQLYAHTRLETTFGMNLIALVNGEPKTLTLRDMLDEFTKHRITIITRRTQFDLQKAEARAHILEGLIVALNNVDAVIKLIRESQDVAAAKAALQSSFPLSVKQAEAILEMRLSRLASMEQQKVREEHAEVLKLIVELRSILDSQEKIRGIIKTELDELVDAYGDERRTEIIEGGDEVMLPEDLIKKEDMIVTISNRGYIKRLAMDTYRQQNRGGKGVKGQSTREDDFAENIFIANTHAYLLFFTTKGIVHWLKVHQIPEGSRTAMGKAIVNLLDLDDSEKVSAVIPVEKFDETNNLIMATRNGTVKKTGLAHYSRPRRGGIIAITLDQEDELISVRRTDGNNELLIASSAGNAVRFNEKDVRPTGRSARGVRGMKLRENDVVVSMVLADSSREILTITENGFGKRTALSEYRVTKRGGLGVINIQTSERNGKVVSVVSTLPNDDLIIMSRSGIVIRVAASDISSFGRNTQGSRIMRLKDGDHVVGLAQIAAETE